MLTEYRIRQIGAALKRREMRVVGKASLGDRWPDEPHAWIIEDLVEHETLHVPCDERPTWGRYYNA